MKPLSLRQDIQVQHSYGSYFGDHFLRAFPHVNVDNISIAFIAKFGPFVLSAFHKIELHLFMIISFAKRTHGSHKSPLIAAERAPQPPLSLNFFEEA
jgi:hypothetical protein